MPRRGLLALFAFFSLGPGGLELAAPQATRRYTVLMMERAAGHQTSTDTAGGRRRLTFEFTDRGRGPKLASEVTIGADGTPTLVETSGVDYLKSPVHETFRLEDGRASWRSHAEDGEKTVTAPAFYVGLIAVPEETALLARALLGAPGGRLPLLPEGEAAVRRVRELEVASSGQSKTVVLYVVSGLGFAPAPVWLERDGTFFAAGSSWLGTVREGWEQSFPALLEAQEAVEAERAAAAARTLARRPSGPLVFAGADVFDAGAAAVRRRQTVVVLGDRIAAVSPEAEVRVPPGAHVIAAEGKMLLPGLWDMHVHVSEGDGPLHVAAGVTSVRDLANDVEDLLARRRSFDQGTAIGPRVVAAGFIDGPGPYAAPTTVLAADERQALAAVARYADLGYGQIKVYSSVLPSLVPVIVEEAHRRQMRVSGHVPAGMTAEEVVRLGFDEIQHANFLFLNFMAGAVKDTRTPERFTAVAERAATLDLGSEAVQRFIRLLRERQVVVDPTVNVFEAMFTDRPGRVGRGSAAIAARLPAQVRRGLLAGGLPVPEGMDGRYRESFAALLKMVAMLHGAGVPLVAGTDALPGFMLHRELELYVEAGIPAGEVLRIATLGAARVAGREAELGTVSPGKKADLVLVDGDPTARIGDVRRAVTVVKDGVVYDPQALYASIGVAPAR